MEIIRYWKGLAFFAGAVLLWYVVQSFGISQISGTIHRMGLVSVAVFFFYPVMTIWDVTSWRLLFCPQYSSFVSFPELFWIRLAGEAVNNVTPFVDIGGEPVKAGLLAKRFKLPMDEAAASTVIAKTSILISQAVFMFMGAVLCFALLDISAVFRFQLAAALFVVCFIFAGFLFIQQKGAFQSINPRIKYFYSNHGDLFWSGVAFNWMGWIFGGLETYFFCQLAGANISILEGVMLEALLQLVRTGSFFVPMNLGVQEGAMALFVGLMGFEPAMGVSISLMKRFRQLLWTVVGFMVLGIYRYAEFKKSARLRNSEIYFLDTRIDRWIHRPPANFLAFLISKTKVTPNQVTLCSIFPAILSSAFFAVGSFSFALAGLFFFYMWAVVDHADGSLARKKQKASFFGEKLDDFCNILSSSIILFGVFHGFVVLWNTKDQMAISCFFYPALFANALSSQLLMTEKRKAQKNILSFMSCRGAFYFILLQVLFARAVGNIYWFANTFVMGFFVISLWVVSIFSMLIFFKQNKLCPE